MVKSGVDKSVDNFLTGQKLVVRRRLRGSGAAFPAEGAPETAPAGQACSARMSMRRLWCRKTSVIYRLRLIWCGWMPGRTSSAARASGARFIACRLWSGLLWGLMTRRLTNSGNCRFWNSIFCSACLMTKKVVIPLMIV